MANEMRIVNIRVDEDMYCQLEKYAEEHQTKPNISEIIRLAIVQFLDSNNSKK